MPGPEASLFDDLEAALQGGSPFRPNAPAKPEQQRLKLDIENDRNPTPSDCLDFGKSARLARGAPDTV